MPPHALPEAPAFTLTCPAKNSPDLKVRAIRARGNLPLMIDDRLLAEIAQGDLVESWETAVHLSAAALADMSKLAGARLASVLEDNIDAADLTDVVSDAAVLFLLAMRRAGVRTPDEIGPCTLLWDEERRQELVLKRT
ncbi:hypothetical protein [Taklimakanibacter deserti]|uniref:hypothetical protein n=1 Tax=Taklimakanibacter deserti TaxID=2267839 RepID=UPI000E65BA4B